jgi:putative flippase GtrA
MVAPHYSSGPPAEAQTTESLPPPHNAAGSTLIPFILVGGSGVLGYAALSTLLLALPTGWPDWFSGGLAYALMILPVYLAHRRFSFRSDAPHRVALPRYVAVQGMAIALAAALSHIAYDLLHLPSAAGSLAVSVLTAGFTFVVLRLWAFAAR